MQETYTITLPLKIRTHVRDKQNHFLLNLNVYRNANHFTLGKAKDLYEAAVKKLITHLPKMLKADIHYTLFTGSNTLVDISNICCIVDKFFCDTLVNNHKLPDDNYNHINKISYQFGSIDKENPRVEATLYNITFEEEEPMRIVIEESEIKQAIEMLVRTQITVNPGQGVIVTLNGNTANIDIVTDSGQPKVTEKPTESVSKPEVKQDASGLKEAFDKVPPVTEPEKEETQVFQTDNAAAQASESANVEAAAEATKPAINLIPKTTSATEAPSATTAPKSLFSNLKTPK